MYADYSFKILEAILTAKKYENKEDVLSTAELIVKVARSCVDDAPYLSTSYINALKKLQSLTFEEMAELVNILDSYNDEEIIEDKENNPQTTTTEGFDDFGETDYQKGMDHYAKKEYKEAVSCFSIAAQKGHGKAKYNYAFFLYTGKGIAIDKVEAIKLFVSASEYGVWQADQMLRFIAYGEKNR